MENSDISRISVITSNKATPARTVDSLDKPEDKAETPSEEDHELNILLNKMTTMTNPQRKTSTKNKIPGLRETIKEKGK